MTFTTLQVISLLAALVIFFKAEPALNRMGPPCRWSVRISFWSLTVGSAGLGLSITQGYEPPALVATAACVFAALLAIEQHVKALLRNPGIRT